MDEKINKALAVLKSGGIILHKTDTIWGLACDAGNEKAIKKLYQIKKREIDKPLIILLDKFYKVSRFVREIPEMAEKIIEISERPTTIIYDNGINLPNILLNKNGSIAIRICQEENCNKLIRLLKRPIASSSANISRNDYPKSFKHISKEIKNQVDYILDDETKNNESIKTSSIIKLSVNNQVEIIRS